MLSEYTIYGYSVKETNFDQRYNEDFYMKLLNVFLLFDSHYKACTFEMKIYSSVVALRIGFLLYLYWKLHEFVEIQIHDLH